MENVLKVLGIECSDIRQISTRVVAQDRGDGTLRSDLHLYLSLHP